MFGNEEKKKMPTRKRKCGRKISSPRSCGGSDVKSESDGEKLRGAIPKMA